MGAGVSGDPVYLTRSTMLISHTPLNHQPGNTQRAFRRQSTLISAPGPSGGISSQLTLPIQFYPNNVYQNHGQQAQVNGFESPSVAPTPRPSAPPSHGETPPTYNSIYPNLAHRVN